MGLFDIFKKKKEDLKYDEINDEINGHLPEELKEKAPVPSLEPLPPLPKFKEPPRELPQPLPRLPKIPESREKLPPLPKLSDMPKLPELSDLEEEKQRLELPSVKKPEAPIPKELKLASEEPKAQVFVKINQYKAILKKIDDMEIKVKALKDNIDKLKRLKSKEDEIISGWDQTITKAKDKLDDIDETLAKL